jgi:hypothetical protein
MDKARPFEMTLEDLTKTVEALDMLQWERKVTLQPDPGVAVLLKRLDAALKAWKQEGK